MRYIHASWLHDDPDDPVELYSEIDEQSWEVRKVEMFRGGRIGFASDGESSGTTMLGLAPIPPLSEIAEQPEFRPEEINKEEFERVWNLACPVVRTR